MIMVLLVLILVERLLNSSQVMMMVMTCLQQEVEKCSKQKEMSDKAGTQFFKDLNLLISFYTVNFQIY